MNNEPMPIAKPTNPVIKTIDRWGPGLISVLGILALIAITWTRDKEIARLKGLVEGRLQMEQSLRNEILAFRGEIQLWQSHVIVLRTEMIKQGLEVPDPPTKEKK